MLMFRVFPSDQVILQSIHFTFSVFRPRCNLAARLLKQDRHAAVPGACLRTSEDFFGESITLSQRDANELLSIIT